MATSERIDTRDGRLRSMTVNWIVERRTLGSQRPKSDAFGCFEQAQQPDNKRLCVRVIERERPGAGELVALQTPEPHRATEPSQEVKVRRDWVVWMTCLR